MVLDVLALAGGINNSKGMELFSSKRWKLDRFKQKAVVFVLNPEKLCNTCKA